MYSTLFFLSRVSVVNVEKVFFFFFQSSLTIVILFAGAPQTCDTEGHVEPVVGLCDNNRPLDVQLRRGRRLARFDRRLRRVGPSARCHFRSSFVFSIFAPRNSRLGTRIPFSFLQPYLLFLFDLTGLLWLCIINGSI